MAKLRAVLAGALGGLAGAALMAPVHMAAAELAKQEAPKGEDATQKVAQTVVAKTTGRKLPRAQKAKAGQVVHFAFGAAMGALYGLLAENFPFVTAGAGTLFGAAVYTGAHALTVPALGLAPGPAENGAAREAAELGSHVVYGVVTDAVRRALT